MNDNVVSTTEDERIEGLDQPAELDMSDYPLDSMLIRSATYSVDQVCKRINQGTYIMNPDFQRDFIWTPEQQSRLIESLLMRIPLPVFYLAERDDGKVIVIDGLQRLSSIKAYIDNEFSLRYLENDNDVFNKKYFKDLDIKLQNRIEDSQLIIYILDSKLPERAKLDIFERVNSGTPLSRQQMRNSIYNGPATRLLAQLSKDKIFLEATGRSLNAKTMRDREFINRFFAFYCLGLDAYKGDMDQYLAECLVKLNQEDKATLEKLQFTFIHSMNICFQIWGRHAFRKHAQGQNQRNVINAALFDVLSVLMAGFQGNISENRKVLVQQTLFGLFADPEFDQAITTSTNSVKRVQLRFKMTTNAFHGVLHAEKYTHQRVQML